MTAKWRTWEGNFGETLDLPHFLMITMFHVTPSRNVTSILKRGLRTESVATYTRTGPWTHNFIFLEDSPEAAKSWAVQEGTGVRKWALLRVSVRRENMTFTGGGWATEHFIPPNDIRVVEYFEV